MTLRRKPKRSWPQRLIGDTATLRARFREQHPTVPIDLGPRSGYRAWLNAQRRRARSLDRTRPTPSKQARIVDNPALRRAFIAEQAADFETDVGRPLTPRDDLGKPYHAWLRFRGIDPDTGTMTLDGFAFFKSLLPEDNARNRAARDRRRRHAA